jgi:hypothetical protein
MVIEDEDDASVVVVVDDDNVDGDNDGEKSHVVACSVKSWNLSDSSSSVDDTAYTAFEV